MTTIPQSTKLLKTFFALLEASRKVFGQERMCRRAVALALAEVMSFWRHTVTQLLLTLGLSETDWSSWHRLIRQCKRMKCWRWPTSGRNSPCWKGTRAMC